MRVTLLCSETIVGRRDREGLMLIDIADKRQGRDPGG